MRQNDGASLLVHCWICPSAWSEPCWRNPSGCPPSPSAAAETPAQTPAGSPQAAGLTGPVLPESGTPRSGASGWPAAAGRSERPTWPHGHELCGRGLLPGEDRPYSGLTRRTALVGGLRTSEVGESWKTGQRSQERQLGEEVGEWWR